MDPREQEKLNIELANHFELLEVGSYTRYYTTVKVIKYKDALYTFDTFYKNGQTKLKLKMIEPSANGIVAPKKECERWLDKEKDYPALLKWIVSTYDKNTEKLLKEKKSQESGREVRKEMWTLIETEIKNTDIDLVLDGQYLRLRIGTTDISMEKLKKIIAIMKE